MNLFTCIGDIYDIFIEEAEISDIAALLAANKKRRNRIRNGTLAAAASVGIALTVWKLARKKTIKKSA